MASDNKLKQAVEVISRLPDPLRKTAITTLMGTMVPYVGTSKLIVEEMSEQRVVVVARNLRPIRNHIGQVHAATMALAAETATGFVTVMNLKGDKLPLLKSMHVDYRKRTRGALRAVAVVSAEQRERMINDDRGAEPIEVHVTDESGSEPIECELVWAWVPRK